MLSNPVTAAALIASTAAVVAYESNLGGFRDGIEDLTGQERGSLPTLSGALGLTETKTDDAADSLEDYMEAAQRFADQVDKKQTPAVEGLGKAADNTTSSITKLTAASNRFASSSGFRLASITGGENGEKGIPLALGRLQAAVSLTVALNLAGLRGGNAIIGGNGGVGSNVSGSLNSISSQMAMARTRAGTFSNVGGGFGNQFGTGLTTQGAANLGLISTQSFSGQTAGSLSHSLGGGSSRSVSAGGSRSSGRGAGHGGANRNDQYQAQKKFQEVTGGDYARLSLSALTGVNLNLQVTKLGGRGWSAAPIYHFDRLHAAMAEARGRVSLAAQIHKLDPFNSARPNQSTTVLAGLLAEEKAEISTNAGILGVANSKIISLQSTQQGNIVLNGMLDFRERMGLIAGGVN